MLGFDKQLFNQVPIVGILRNISYDDVMHILPIYAEAGLTTLEITMNTIDAPKIIKSVVEKYGDILNIGAGTVCCVQDLDVALSAGAQFIVSPNIDSRVIQICFAQGIPVFPGAYTPTEIYKAWSLGATMVKIFPARSLGTDYIKDILSPLSHIGCMATGGIGIQEIPLYKKAGVKAFGIGSPLFPSELIVRKDWAALKNLFRDFVRIIKDSTKL